MGEVPKTTNKASKKKGDGRKCSSKTIMQTLMSKSESQHVLECHIVFMKCHTSYVLCVVSIEEEVKMKWSEEVFENLWN